jgi:hypothetical protein
MKVPLRERGRRPPRRAATTRRPERGDHTGVPSRILTVKKLYY